MIRRVALLLPLLLLACKQDAPPAEPAPPATSTLTIYATGDIGSDTDVCGCKVRQMGGVARRAKIIRDREADKSVSLVVDAGDLFFRNWTVAPRFEDQARATAEFHADTLAHFAVPAMAVGERDLAMGLSYLRHLAKRGDVKLLSANLRHTSSGTAAFDAFTIAERSGLKIGIVGASPVLDENAQANLVYERAGLRAEPALAHVEAAAKRAREAGAELVVALLHMKTERAQQILDTVEPGVIDVAIVAHDRRSQNLMVSRDARSAFVMPGDRGKWLAVTRVEVKRGAKGIVDVGAVREQSAQIEKIAERIAAYRAESPAKDPKVEAGRAATLARLEARKTALEEDLARIDSDGRHTLEGELVPLDKDLPEDPVVLTMYRRYQDHLQKVNGADVVPRTDMTYVGNAACKSCHAPAFAHWKTTKHAKAWATMQRTRQTANLDCVPCHVTGFDRPGGPRRIAELDRFRDVGCESCHGAGSAHAAKPEVAVPYTRSVPEKVCAECHRAQEDQKPFVYEERLPKILGKGHGAE